MLASGGIPVNCCMCYLQASIAHHSGIAHILSMFFRDDVMAWNKRLQGKTPGTTLLKPPQLKLLVQRNIKDCMERLQMVTMHWLCSLFSLSFVTVLLALLSAESFYFVACV